MVKGGAQMKKVMDYRQIGFYGIPRVFVDTVVPYIGWCDAHPIYLFRTLPKKAIFMPFYVYSPVQVKSLKFRINEHPKRSASFQVAIYRAHPSIQAYPWKEVWSHKSKFKYSRFNHHIWYHMHPAEPIVLDPDLYWLAFWTDESFATSSYDQKHTGPLFHPEHLTSYSSLLVDLPDGLPEEFPVSKDLFSPVYLPVPAIYLTYEVQDE